jgi:AraC-like DNA-binding protein
MLEVEEPLVSASPKSSWEWVAPPVPLHLRPFVRSWVDYTERASGPLRRRELPAPQVVLIVEFGPPIRVYESGSETRFSSYPGGFVAGLDDSFSLTEHPGFQSGIQVNLTPLGARSLFGVSSHELSHRVISLRDLLPERRFSAEELFSSRDRFRRLTELLTLRCSEEKSPRSVTHARARIEASGGLVEIGELAAELGYSRKHLVTLFEEHVGLAPKRYASLVRFDRVLRSLRASPSTALAELALNHGYADQSHLCRELRRFSGLTPRALRALVAPEHEEGDLPR